jgi:hypothetical protein
MRGFFVFDEALKTGFQIVSGKNKKQGAKNERSWLERLVVVQEVVGSRPIFHPKQDPSEKSEGFFCF